MKVLVTGAFGQLGQSLLRILQNNNAEILSPTHAELDITSSFSVHNYFKNNLIDCVIHAAAYCNVEKAEIETELCKITNDYGTLLIANECQKKGIYMIFISTDYVFDGMKQGSYLPYDMPAPLNVYGKTKLSGEYHTLYANSLNLVVRTSWLYGFSKCNFVNSIINSALGKEELHVVNDQIGRPTFAEDLSQALWECLIKRPHGIIHIANMGSCSRAEYAKKIIELSGINCRVIEISSEELNLRAIRPKNSVLNMECLDAIGISRLPQWNNALERYLSQRGYMK